MAAGEDRKPDLKTEPKDDVGSGTPSTPAGISNKKKRENIFHRMYPNGLMQPPTIVYFICIKCIKTLLYFKPPFVGPVFKPEELRQALMPTLESLYRQDPESLPFRQPVDPSLLGIPVCVIHHLWTLISFFFFFCSKSFLHGFINVSISAIMNLWDDVYTNKFTYLIYLEFWVQK